MTFEQRLVAYSPGTDTILGYMLEPLSVEHSAVYDNDGACTIKYSTLADGGQWAARTLTQGLDVGVEYNWGTGWKEPDGCRYLMVGHTVDDTDPAKVATLKLVSWAWLLCKICNLNVDAVVTNKKSSHYGQRNMSDKDAGDVTKIYLTEHDDRAGPAVPIERDSWTTAHDSAGAAWVKKKKSLYHDLGQNLHVIVDAMVTAKMCDYTTRGRGLRMYNQNSASVDRSATVRLFYGDDLTEAPTDEDQSERVARLLVKGKGKKKVTVRDPDVPEFYGRWEGMIDSGGTSDLDDLEDDGQSELDDRNRIRAQLTRGLTMTGTWLPFRDYVPGDWVKAPGTTGMEKLRVQQITITRDENGGLGGNVVLGDRFTAKDLKQAQLLSASTGGSSGTTGGGTTGTNDDGPDYRQPSAPTGFTVTDALYIDGYGKHKAEVHASWDAVTTATDATDLDVQGYQLWGQPDEPGAVWRLITSSTDTAVEARPFDPRSTWLFFVVAVGETTTVQGAQSAQQSITFGFDETAPNQPSTPSAYSELGAGVIGWDGLDSTGDPMPVDFALCRVELSDDAGATWTIRDRFLGPGTVTPAGLTYGQEYLVRLVALDITGNASTPSDTAPFTPRQIVDTDIEDDAIPSAKIASLAANKIITGELAAGEKISAGPLSGNHVELADDGLYAYALIGGVLVPIIRLGTGAADAFALSDADGNVLASISGTGSANFQELSVSDLQIAGMTVEEIVAGLPRGLKSWFTKDVDSAHVSSSTESEWMTLTFQAEPDRLYEITSSHIVDADNADTILGMVVRYEWDGAAVTSSSPALPYPGRAQPNTTAIGTMAQYKGVLSSAGQVAPLRTVTISYRLYHYGGTAGNIWGAANSTYQALLLVKDIGSSDITASARYTSVWEADRVWDFGITEFVGSEPVGEMFSGSKWVQAIFGNLAVSGETDKTLAAALTSAAIEKVEVSASFDPLDGKPIVQKWRANSLTAPAATAPSGTALEFTKTTTSRYRAWKDITSIFDVAKRGLWLGATVAEASTTETKAAYLRVGPEGTITDATIQIRITYTR